MPREGTTETAFCLLPSAFREVRCDWGVSHMISSGMYQKALRGHRDLKVYQLAYSLAMRIFEESMTFPPEERYSLTSQIRRSSRSVAANIAEGFRKRQYPSMFMSKLADSDAEATETQVWLDFARDCGYLSMRVQERTGGGIRGDREDVARDDRTPREIRTIFPGEPTVTRRCKGGTQQSAA